MMRYLGRGLAVGLTLLRCSCLGAQVDVLTQHNDNARTGANLAEVELTPHNVAASSFGMLFKHAVDDQLYTQPLVVTGVTLRGGKHDVVYVTTVNNSVYAFDANDAQAEKPLWQVNFGTPANLNSAPFGCLDINGQMGIIGTPVVDKAKGTLYVVALTKSTAGFEQRLHELDLGTGAEMPEGPKLIRADGFDPLMQNQRPALLLANGMVYVSYASHCDKDPYHGYMMAYDAKTLEQVAAFNTSPTGSEASIWQSGQGPSADGAGNVYVVTGNGSWDGKQNFSESFLRFDAKLKLLDWFTPTNHLQLDKDDNDLNSSGATLIPGTNLVVGGGKEGVLYSIDRTHFGHLGDEHAVQHFKATSSHLHSLVYWKSDALGPLLYVWGQRDKERVYHFSGDKLDVKPLMMRADANEGHPGAMLSLSANGGKDGILWAAIHATGDSWHESRPGILHAYEADNIEHEVWNSLENAVRDDCGRYSKMAPPTVANGRVYLPSFGAENTGTGQLCVYGLLPKSGGQMAAPKVQGSLKDGTVRLRWEAVPGARFYRVSRSSEREPERVVAYGLSSSGYEEAAYPRDEAEYVVTAVGADGGTAASEAVKVKVQHEHTDRMKH